MSVDSRNPAWFVAEVLVLHSIVEGKAHVLHNNFLLIQASDPQRAITAAENRGREHETEFTNTDGHRVTVRFIGLRNLHRVHDVLEDGAEIMYEEFGVQSETEALRWVRSRESFSVFRIPT